MGLDTLELVLRCEEVFSLDLPDWKCERVQTVGDLYDIVCEGLALTPITNPAPVTNVTPETVRARITRGVLNLTPVIWTPENVWTTLVYVITDQLQVDESEVVHHARIHDDLGCD